MRLLLDTHVLLWAALEPQQLSAKQHDALEDSGNDLVVSAASAWEIATKWRLGQLSHAAQVVHNYPQVLNALAASELPITGLTARAAGLLDVDHRDPFDRLLAAQAMAEGLMLVSSDAVFNLFPELELLR